MYIYKTTTRIPQKKKKNASRSPAPLRTRLQSRSREIILIPQKLVILDDIPHHIQQGFTLQAVREPLDRGPRDVLVEGAPHRPPAQRPPALLYLVAFELGEAPGSPRVPCQEVVFGELACAVFD